MTDAPCECSRWWCRDEESKWGVGSCVIAGADAGTAAGGGVGAEANGGAEAPTGAEEYHTCAGGGSALGGGMGCRGSVLTQPKFAGTSLLGAKDGGLCGKGAGAGVGTRKGLDGFVEDGRVGASVGTRKGLGGFVKDERVGADDWAAGAEAGYPSVGGSATTAAGCCPPLSCPSCWLRAKNNPMRYPMDAPMGERFSSSVRAGRCREPDPAIKAPASGPNEAA